MDKKFKNGRIGVYEEKVGCIMENFDIGKQPKKPQKEELSMSVSPICERDGKKIAFVSFSDGTRTAEGEIPECKITKNEGFDEGEASSVLKDSGISACTINEVVVGTKNGESVGCVITVTDSEGYGGEIQFAVGIDNSGVIKGISFLSIAESPGLGMNAKDDPTWKEQYYDKEVASFSVVKGASSSDSEVSALSGATISSKAITAGVNAALCYYNSELGGAK